MVLRALFLGWLCYWLPTFIFAKSISRFTTARQAKEFIIAFFVGETAKLILSGVLFVLCVNYLSVSALFMMMGYISAILAFWVVIGLRLKG